MERLRIRLFGSLEVWVGDRPLSGFPTQKARSLFAFLALHHDRLFPRDYLLGIFWGRQAEGVARKRLRTSLWRMRKLLAPEDADWPDPIVVRGHAIGFDPSERWWLDVREFERTVSTAKMAPGARLDPESVRELEEAVTLYRGDLLLGLYDSWCVEEQGRLKLVLLSVLERLMLHHARERNLEGALHYATTLIGYDPLREHVHREIMHLYYEMGDRPAAIRQYIEYRAQLVEELAIQPMRATTALYRAILAEDCDAVTRRPARSGEELGARRTPSLSATNPPSPSRAITCLRDAEDQLQAAREGLVEAARLLGH